MTGFGFPALGWTYLFFLPFSKGFGIRSLQDETAGEFVNEQYLKRLMKFIAELAAIAIAVVLLQLFIGWVGFETAWPILLGVLIVLVVIIAAMRK